MQDHLQAFIINTEEYRGVLVHLDQCYQEINELHAYPLPIAKLLGEALAAVSLLGHNIKQEGKLALQIQSSGCIKLLVAEANHQRGIRGLVQWRDDLPLTGNLIEAGKFAMTLMPKNGERYQGVVPLVQHDIAKSLEAYFNQSEQIFTRILLACDGTRAAGLLLQKLPLEHEPTLDTNTLNLMLDTVQADELLNDSNEQLLHKLFHEQTVHLFDQEAIRFECTCNHDKMIAAVKMLGKEDAFELLSTHKNVEVVCEFCNHRYGFDKAEVEKIFEV